MGAGRRCRSVLITSVDFANAEKGWATGHHGVILTTEDGGQWTRQLDGFNSWRWKAFYQTKVSALQAQIKEEEDQRLLAT